MYSRWLWYDSPMEDVWICLNVENGRERYAVDISMHT